MSLFPTIRRNVLENYLSDGMDDLGPIKWSLALCVFAVFVLVYFSLWKGVRSTGKVITFPLVSPHPVSNVSMGESSSCIIATSTFFLYIWLSIRVFDLIGLLNSFSGFLFRLLLHRSSIFSQLLPPNPLPSYLSVCLKVISIDSIYLLLRQPKLICQSIQSNLFLSSRIVSRWPDYANTLPSVYFILFQNKWSLRIAQTR